MEDNLLQISEKFDIALRDLCCSSCSAIFTSRDKI